LKKLLYVCEADSGGIMEYAIRQSEAIALEGCEVHFLCKESFPVERLGAGIILEKFQERRGARGESRGLAGKLSTIWRLTLGQRQNAKQVAKLAYQLAQPSSTSHQLPSTRDRPGSAEVVVLFACYKEYFSPFWAGPLRQLANKGAVIGTIAHDPVRDFVMGPLWWHRWCVRLGYSFVRHVFVHDDTPVDFGGAQPQGIQIHQIPHGPYEVCEPKIGRLEMRKRLGFSSDLTTIEHWGGRENRKLWKAEGRATESWPQRGAASGTMQVKEQPQVGPKGEGEGSTESKDTTERLGGREMEQPKVGPKGEVVGTTESKSTEVEAGACLDKPSCASESDSLPSKLADSPTSESLTRSASGPASSPATGYSLLATALEVPSPTTSYSALATPASPDVVFLAFGQIRDGKNLDLFLKAMPSLPEHVKLLVAGKGDSSSSKAPQFYQKLADDLGVSHRCRWDIRRIPEDEVGDFFAAADIVILTYSANFHSASGVLNAAVSARRPVLASSGEGPLKKAVQRYRLGVFVSPDNLECIVQGARTLVNTLGNSRASSIATPEWELYDFENSWEINANRVVSALMIKQAGTS
jgi:glycosyltransferase involved in cell wall biosynthesis